MENNHVVHSVRVTLLCCAAPVTHVILVSVSVLQTDELWVSWEAATSWSSLKLCMDELMVLCHSLAQQGNGPPSSRLFATQDFKRQPCFDDMLSFKAQTLFSTVMSWWRGGAVTCLWKNRHRSEPSCHTTAATPGKSALKEFITCVCSSGLPELLNQERKLLQKLYFF